LSSDVVVVAIICVQLLQIIENLLLFELARSTVCDMCGIVGYVGHRRACDVVIDALRRMEYRGYDSAGVAVVDGRGTLTVCRRAGRLAWKPRWTPPTR
jgi:hypothetical protein